VKKIAEENEKIEVYNLGSFVEGMAETLAELEALVREPDNLQWFTNLWENAREAADFYELVQHLCPEIDHEQWDKAWQWRTILHEDFDQAVIEFTNALYGWY